MHKSIVGCLLVIAVCTWLKMELGAQGTTPELQLITRAADALGGRDRVMALKTLQIVGYGELAYFNGGGNITGIRQLPRSGRRCSSTPGRSISNTGARACSNA